MSLESIDDVLIRAYDAERFRAQGHRLIDRLADHLAAAMGAPADGDDQVLPYLAPDAAVAAWPPAFEEEPAEDLVDCLTRTAAGSSSNAGGHAATAATGARYGST